MQNVFVAIPLLSLEIPEERLLNYHYIDYLPAHKRVKVVVKLAFL
jgi:hypothetical protein